jgi:hypothetical protein
MILAESAQTEFVHRECSRRCVALAKTRESPFFKTQTISRHGTVATDCKPWLDLAGLFACGVICSTC